MSELENVEVGEDVAVEDGVQVGKRKPKRLLQFNTPATWLYLGVSEALLRTKPNEPRLFPCSNPEDPAAEARALVAYADRINRNIEQFVKKQREATGEKVAEGEKFFTITTAQCLTIYTDRSQKDVLERCIRCVVTKNWLFDAALEHERQAAELAAQAGVEEASSPSEPIVKRGRGRPRKTIQPVPVGPAVVKRGRGRPKKNPEQGSLV